MIRSLYLAARERRWNRDRRRRIAVMLERERTTRMAEIGCVEVMAIQLAEIRALPEVLEPQPKPRDRDRPVSRRAEPQPIRERVGDRRGVVIDIGGVQWIGVLEPAGERHQRERCRGAVSDQEEERS
jgi:hypothetical protein